MVWLVHVVGAALAAGAIAAAVAGYRRYRDRVPLIHPMDWRVGVLTFAVLIPLVGLIWAAVSILMAAHAPAFHVVIMLGWTSALFVAGLMAVITRSHDRLALGWVEYLGGKRIAVEVDGRRHELDVRPEDVTLYSSGGALVGVCIATGGEPIWFSLMPTLLDTIRIGTLPTISALPRATLAFRARRLLALFRPR
jgi:hypothetical protein